MLDRLMQPLQEVLLEAITPGQASRVLDVGCGTGGTTLALAGRLGPAGSAVGIDISEPMIAAASLRAQGQQPQPRFVVGDAETYPFEPESYDMLVSRFGVMFFGDPVRAFANLRRATRAGGWLRALAFRDLTQNPFMTTAERAAAPLLQALPRRSPSGPGQFAFAERPHVERILRDSGWSAIDLQPADVPCTMLASEIIPYATRMGPVGRALEGAGAELRAAVVERLVPAFAPFVCGDEVRFTSACWLLQARA